MTAPISQYQQPDVRPAPSETDRGTVFRVHEGHLVHRRQRSIGTTPHSVAFWLVASAFLLNMAFSAVPTPLYVLYQQRDHISQIMVTIVYAVYAIGVIASLFLAGHVSDWVGRRKVLVWALLVNVTSAVIFILVPSLPGLIVARIVSGVAVGLTTATATAYLAELHQRARPTHSDRRAQVVAAASNLGGIGIGPLVAGLLAAFAPAPLRLPYLVFGLALAGLALLVAIGPETADRPGTRPHWRPQRVVVPARARGEFFAATFAGLAACPRFKWPFAQGPLNPPSRLQQDGRGVSGVRTAVSAGIPTGARLPG